MEEQYPGHPRSSSPQLKVLWKLSSSPQARLPAKSPGLRSFGRILSPRKKHQRYGVIMKLPLLLPAQQSITTGLNTSTSDISLSGMIWSKGGDSRFNTFPDPSR